MGDPPSIANHCDSCEVGTFLQLRNDLPSKSQDALRPLLQRYGAVLEPRNIGNIWTQCRLRPEVLILKSRSGEARHKEVRDFPPSQAIQRSPSCKGRMIERRYSVLSNCLQLTIFCMSIWIVQHSFSTEQVFALHTFLGDGQARPVLSVASL